jgi:hypothetical protein
VGLFFDRRFIDLLRIGDIEGAIALLLKKYPHLKNDKDQQARYIGLYSARLCKTVSTNVGHWDGVKSYINCKTLYDGGEI